MNPRWSVLAWRLKITLLVEMFAGVQEKKTVSDWLKDYEAVNPTLLHFFFFFFISCKVPFPVLPAASQSFNRGFISHLSRINIVSECRHRNINLIE